MSELQSTIEFSVELFKFFNVDLFQRGMYQIRCSLRASSKLSVEIEVTAPEITAGLGTAIVLGNYGACRPFKVLYRNEEVLLKDVILFRCHMLVDGNNLRESFDRAEFSLIVELWFHELSPVHLAMVCSRTLQLNMSPIDGLHYNLPILFDYFHLSALSLTIHSTLTALHQPPLKKGLLRYMQSCAPKSSKSWSKLRSAQCTSLTDPVLPVSSSKIYSRINESPQIYLEAYNVLLDSRNNLKATIKEYKRLMQQREESVVCYHTLFFKHNEYDSTMLMRKRPYSHNCGLAELCAENIKLWNYFLLTFSCKLAIQQYLSKKHHTLRVRRFSELFFYIHNPREAAYGSYETNYQNYLVFADIARRSKYMQMLPPLPVHCVALDGETANMPVIFEDHYEDPLFYKKKHHEEAISSPTNDFWRLQFAKTDQDSTNCSCGLGKLWENKKNAKRNLLNSERYTVGDPLSFTVPARHSKSLDHLQLCSTNNFNTPLSNFAAYKNVAPPAEKSRFPKKADTLKNVASEHSMRKNYECCKYTLDDSEDLCSCSFNKSNSLKALNNSQRRQEVMPNVDGIVNSSQGIVEKKYKQFSIKNLSNISKQYQTIAKSLRQTNSESTQRIFKSNSMQFSSPIKKKNSSKIISILTRKHAKTCKLDQQNGSTYEPSEEQILYDQKRKSKRKRGELNGKYFEIGSTSSSTESLVMETLKTGSEVKNFLDSNGIRRFRSTSCITDENIPLVLSNTHSESLPDIGLLIKEGLYWDVKYYNCGSSTTTEGSGFISTRSSSGASSTDSTNSTTSVIVNLRNIEKITLELEDERNGTKKKILRSRKKSKINRPDTSNGYNGNSKHYEKFEQHVHSTKASITDLTNPSTSAILNLQNIEKNYLGLEDEKTGAKKKIVTSRKKSNKFRPDISNGYNGTSSQNYQKFEQHAHSSKASRINLTNPSTSAIVNLQNIEKNSLGLEDEKTGAKKKTVTSRKKSSKFRPEISNGYNSTSFQNYQNFEQHAYSSKGCEENQSNKLEDIALPPPKQFRDLDSSSSSVSDSTNDEEINAVDNLLYHVVDTQTTLERRPSQFNKKLSSNETEDCDFFKDDTKALETFLKAKNELKSQLNFPGMFYSDLNNFAATIPYFYISDEFRLLSPYGLHLVICVHGLDGNPADLRLVKTYLELGLPGSYLDFLMSDKNQGDTFSDFDIMTEKLIEEIIIYMTNCAIRPTRISFIGHSLGNIIIRSALTSPQMKFLLPRLHTFLSLSGPHLGTLYNSSGLVNMGLWVMQKWKKSNSLLQLCLKDSSDPRQCFIYRLSQRSNLHHFKNILLCSSGQDRYVPLHSARIELCKESLKDTSDQGNIYREMVHNILTPILAKTELNLIRYDIHHALPNTANALIGRAAHIAVLDSELFIEKFMLVVGVKYFR